MKSIKTQTTITCLLIFVANCFIAQQNFIKEKYELNWLATNEWKLVQHNELEALEVSVYAHPNESLTDWTELGYTIHYKEVVEMPIDSFMYKMHSQVKIAYPTAQVKFIDKKENKNSQWILFAIEVPESLSNSVLESQIYHITQGKNGVYSSYIMIKRNSFTEAEIKKWSSFLKKAKMVKA
jgi:hypothetical protein